MSKTELGNYIDWFHDVMDQRIGFLIAEVKSTPGYKQWSPDFSRKSLEAFGDWLLNQAEARPRTQDEINEISSHSKVLFAIQEDELTNKTFSLATDVGMYVSQVLLKNHRKLQWSQVFGSRKSADYGQPVLTGFGKVPFNPVAQW